MSVYLCLSLSLSRTGWPYTLDQFLVFLELPATPHVIEVEVAELEHDPQACDGVALSPGFEHVLQDAVPDIRAAAGALAEGDFELEEPDVLQRLAGDEPRDGQGLAVPVQPRRYVVDDEGPRPQHRQRPPRHLLAQQEHRRRVEADLEPTPPAEIVGAEERPARRVVDGVVVDHVPDLGREVKERAAGPLARWPVSFRVGVCGGEEERRA